MMIQTRIGLAAALVIGACCTSRTSLAQAPTSDAIGISGTRWDSNWIAALFRLTLPDGQPGVATALFPYR